MSLLDRILANLAAKGLPAAIIGALALAPHGVVRASEDFDLLVLDRSVLSRGFWEDWEASSEIEIRRGDPDDPLAGVVRVRADGEIVDLVVGRECWMPAVLERWIEIQLGSRMLPVVSRADLVLLKLFAGGPQDLLDVEFPLAAHLGDLKTEVERHLKGRSALKKAWQRLLMRSSHVLSSATSRFTSPRVPPPWVTVHALRAMPLQLDGPSARSSA